MCQPTAPNPASVIQQQTASNKETAIAQAGLNMVNQTDSAGNQLSYQQIGKWADGTPRYSSTQTLGAAGQALQASNQGTAQNIANLANEQSGRLSGLLGAPIDFSAQRDYLENLTSGALDKRWDTLGQQNETDLINRGIRPGSAQYDNLKNQFMVNQSDAYNSANVNNYNTALQSQLALRQQPINEILALSGSSQLQAPSFGSTPQTGLAGVDTAGIQQQAFANQQNQWGNNQGIIGGLFSAGASLLPLLSDRRAKRDIELIGVTEGGNNVYRFRYLDSDEMHTGVMAQEVMETNPDAVWVAEDGYLRVNYAMVA